MTEGEGVVFHQRWREKNTKNIWFMSIPGAPSRHEAFIDTFNSLDLTQIERYGRLKVPSFKLITYDNLVDLMHQLRVLDRQSAMLLRRTEDKILEVLPHGPMLITAFTVSDRTLLEYLEIFEWDKRKYPDDMKISDVVKGLGEDSIDLQDQFHYYNCARRDAVVSLEAFIRKSSGAVTTREINCIIPDESYIVESKNLTTLFVVVPKHLSKLWSDTYEHITQLIVPGSSNLMGSDSDFDLYNLVIWRAGAEAFREFITTETELTFRMFQFDRDEFLKAKAMEGRLHENEKSTTQQLVNWLRINFRRTFLHTIHVKLLRLHVESLIRYGIPFRFQIFFVQPEPKKIKKLNKELEKMFKHLELKIDKSVKKSGILDPNYKTYPFTTMTVYMIQ